MNNSYTLKNPVLPYIDRKDALSFLGYRNYPDNMPDDNIINLLDKYEKLLLNNIQPRYIYKMYVPDEISDLLIGSDINEHINGCGIVMLMCVTLGLEADRLITKTAVSDVAGSVMLDALAGAAVEQICNICENDIKSIYPEKTATSRYSPGYGNFPIELQNNFLAKLDANRKLGLYVNERNIMIPRKSVTAVIGLNDTKG